MDADEVRAKAHERNNIVRDKHPHRFLKEEPFRSQVATYIDSIPLDPSKLKHCPACEGVVCEVCGRCHELDRKYLPPVDPACPAKHPMFDTDTDCVAWAYAYIFLRDEDKKARSRA